GDPNSTSPGLPFTQPAGKGQGAGIYNTGSVVCVNVTVASNLTAPGQGLTPLSSGANIANTNGILSLLNSIIAYSGTNTNAWGTITDAGFNMSSDGSAN